LVVRVGGGTVYKIHRNLSKMVDITVAKETVRALDFQEELEKYNVIIYGLRFRNTCSHDVRLLLALTPRKGKILNSG